MTIAWLFPGQGSQTVGMGRDLITESPAAKAVFDQADQTLGFPLSRYCFEGPEKDLTATENAQPALLTMSIALVRALETLLPPEALPHPQAVAGHSLGEYSALVVGGAFDFPTALRLVRRRGELMAAASQGTMAAIIGLDEQVLKQVCLTVTTECGAPVVIANYNAPDQLVISGDNAAVAKACALAKAHGARRALPLKVSAAFHSPLMSHAAQEMTKAIAAASITDLTVPLIANVTGTPLTTASQVRQELGSQITSPVVWTASVQQLDTHGITTFIEFGPGTVLTSLVKRILPSAHLINLTDWATLQAFAQQLQSAHRKEQD
jgi:[acyl-carrier-protein] S-malonyltransferase